MIQTAIVYLLLLVSMFLLTLKYSKVKILSLEGSTFLALLLYTFVFGIRYGVGKDYFAYLDDYFAYQWDINFKNRNEYGFDALSKLFAILQLHYSFYFGFFAFIQLYFLFLSYKDKRELIPYISVSFILGCTFLSWMNGIRQNISFAIFIFSLKYIIDKRPVQFYFFIFLACLFHNSAIILVFIYPIFAYRSNSYIDNIPIQIILLTLVIFVNGRLNDSFFETFGLILTLMDYSHYSEFTEEGVKNSIGAGYFIILVINIVLILDSVKLKKYFKNSTFYVVYDLFFFGCLWYYFFFGSIPLARPNYYFYGFNFLVTAHYLMYQVSRVKRGGAPIKLLLMLFLLFLLFIAYLSSCEINDFKYMFFWES